MNPPPQQEQQPSTSSTPLPISEQSQEQRAKIIEIISGTANGCLNELGYYPQLINDLKQQNQALLHQVNQLRSVGEQTILTLQNKVKDLEHHNNNLFQDNRTLALNNTILIQDNERLKKENLAKQECIDNLQRGMMSGGSLMDQYQKACVTLQQLTEKHSDLILQYNMLVKHHASSSSQSGPSRHPDRRQSMPSASVNRQSLEHPPQSVAQPQVNISAHGQLQRQHQPALYVPSHNPQLNPLQIPPNLRAQQSQSHPPQTRPQQLQSHAPQTHPQQSQSHPPQTRPQQPQSHSPQTHPQQSHPLNVRPQPPHYQPPRSQQQTHPQQPPHYVQYSQAQAHAQERTPNASQTAPPPALRISTQSQSEQNMRATQQMPPTPPMSSMSERPEFLHTPASRVHSPIVQPPHPPPFSAPREHPQATPVQPPTPPVSHKSMSPEASQETKPVIDNQGNVVTGESSTAPKKRPSMSMEDGISHEANKRAKIEEVEDAPMPADTPSSDDECIEVGPDGLRPIYNCILEVVEEVEDDEKDVQKLICLLCQARHMNGVAPEPTPFVDPTPEELEAHFMSLHAAVIEKMRRKDLE